MGQEPELIPRKTLFGNPDRADVRISHDGTRISYLAPVDGVLNVWVAPVDAIQEARPVTQDTDRGIWFYVWTYNPDRILYIQDSEGDENWHVYAVDVETQETRDLTPFEGVHAMILPMSRRFPNEALVGLNVRDPRYHDIHRVDILTGEMSLVLENDIGAFGLLTDDDFRVRLATVTSEGGGMSTLERSDSGEWLPFMEIDLEDGMTTYPLGMDISGRTLYMADSRGRNTSALARFDFDNRKRTILASDDHADLSWDFMIHPATGHVQAVSFEYDRMRWHVVDESIASDLERIRGADDGEFKFNSRSHDDARWIVYFVKDDGPYNVPPLRPRARRGRVPLHQSPGFGEIRPPSHEIRGRKLKGRSGYGRLLHAAHAGGRGGRYRAREAHSDRAARPRRSAGARQLGIRPPTPIARQPRIRRGVRKLPRLDGVRQGVRQRW